ncbi:hypothetical protein J7T55_004964 [Diaporthe amygdali]|uniref:uncharacterized protein n=1 Tax=Phomopsis amygdali TaxID=1214568 RepID=UPI0022FECEDE|nr:uncharacterized protein J7T55_004964 [Diaporthe amygdali]KAJ0114720.1 hypothetical protein J7T55_004964 [Diaporthe amygdali]
MVHSLYEVAQADSYHVFAGSALLGVLFHVSIQFVEFEKFMFHFLAALLVMSIAVSTAFSIFGQVAWRFPGPFGAKLSRFWTAYISSKNAQYYKELEKMQAKYGDFVRTGPREITVFRATAVSAIYGPASKLLKSTWFGQSGNDPDKCSLHMPALAEYQPRIKAKSDLLKERIQDRAGQPIDITKWAMFYSFDVVGEVAFGKDFANLVTGIEHSAIKPIHEHIRVFGVLSPLPWLMNILTCIPSASSIYTEIFSFCANEIRAKQKVSYQFVALTPVARYFVTDVRFTPKSWDNEEYPNDIVSWLLKAVFEKDASAAPTKEALDYDSRLVLLAGSDTTSSTLANALFYLCKNVATQKKLREKLQRAHSGGARQWDYEKVQLVTYLDDIIAETLRLRPAVLVAGSRETQATGLQIDEVHIPGNTNVLVSVYSIQRDPRYWSRANEFIPERWGDRRSEMGTDKAPYLPFLAGAYSCPGKNFAYMSLRIALSILVQNFDISFSPGENGYSFENNALDCFVITLPPLHLNFTPLVL